MSLSSSSAYHRGRDLSACYWVNTHSALLRYQIHSEGSEAEAADVDERWGAPFPPNWENIVILSQEFPHYGKIFRSSLAQPCTSPPLPLTFTACEHVCTCVCVCVYVGRQACLQLFTYDGFSTQDAPPALSFSPSCRALLSPTFSLVLFSSLLLFSAPFTPCLPSFHASNLSSSPTPIPPTTTTTTINPHPPPSLPSPSLSHLYSGLTSNGCVSPPFSRFLIQPSKLCSAIAHPTTQSPLMSGKPVGIRVLLLIISFTGNPHRPRCASGWRGEGEGERMKGRTEWSCVKSGWHVQPGSCCMRRRAKVAHAALSDER